MTDLPRISPEKLKSFLHNCVDEFAEKVVDNVNAAQSGRLIADSEEGVRDLIDEFGRAAFQAALQQKVDALEASFSPSGGNGDRPGHETTRAKTSAEQGTTVAQGADNERAGEAGAAVVAFARQRECRARR